MGTASIRRPSYRQYRDPLCLPSPKFTPLLVGRVDSGAPRGALLCTARTSERPVTMERTSPSAGSKGPLLLRAQVAESSQHPGGEGCRVEDFGATSPRVWNAGFAGAIR